MTAPMVLRALSLGELLDASFGLYRRLFLALVFVSILTQGIPVALAIYVELSGGALAMPATWAFTMVLSVVASQIGIGTSTFLVAEAYLGGSLTPQEGFKRATPFLGRLIGAAFLSSLLYAIGLLLFVVPGVIFVCGLIVTTPALVLENLRSPTAAMSRSWFLTKGFKGRIFAALLLAIVLISIPAIGLSAFMTFGRDEATGLLVLLLVQSLLQLLVYPFVYVLTTLFYYDLRVRKEAYDLEMLAGSLSPV